MCRPKHHEYARRDSERLTYECQVAVVKRLEASNHHSCVECVGHKSRTSFEMRATRAKLGSTLGLLDEQFGGNGDLPTDAEGA